MNVNSFELESFDNKFLNKDFFGLYLQFTMKQSLLFFFQVRSFILLFVPKALQEYIIA